jgi:hypothetical protein
MADLAGTFEFTMDGVKYKTEGSFTIDDTGFMREPLINNDGSVDTTKKVKPQMIKGNFRDTKEVNFKKLMNGQQGAMRATLQLINGVVYSGTGGTIMEADTFSTENATRSVTIQFAEITKV